MLFHCAYKTSITQVLEPSVCSYEVHVGTPVACTSLQGRFLRTQLTRLGMTAEEINDALSKLKQQQQQSVKQQ